MKSDANVVHETSARRFVAKVDEGDAELNYVLDGAVLDIVHTFVPPAARGRNLADTLVRAAVAYAESEKLKIRPSCSYVQHWFAQHGDQRQLLAD